MNKRVQITTTNGIVYDQRMNRVASTLHDMGCSVHWIGRKQKQQAAAEIPSTTFSHQLVACRFNSGFLFYLEYNLRLFLRLLFRRYDLGYAVDLDTLPAHACIYFLTGRKVIFDAHEWFTEVPELTNRRLVRGIWKMMERICMPAVEVGITVGPALADVFEKQWERKFAVVRNVPQQQREASKPWEIWWQEKKENPIILYQGALNVGRGLEAMIAAMPFLPEFTLELIGEGDLSESLREQAKKLGNKQVVFRGFIPPHDLPLYTRKALLGLNVSVNLGKSYYYSLNNKFFDYTQARLPQLVNPFPEYLRLLEQHGVGIVVENDPELLAQTIRQAYQHPEQIKRCYLACEAASQAWHWGNERETIKALSIWA